MKVLYQLVGGFLILISGFAFGSVFSEQKAWSQQAAANDREAKIMSFIVDRNPDATIKDFQAFPRFLLEQSQAAGLDYRLVLAIIDKESEFKPKAVSHAGAIGLMQLMPGTGELMAKSLKLPFTPSVFKNGRYEKLGTLEDPYMNLRLGIEYFRLQVARFGTTGTALRAYNRPPDRALENRPHDRYAEDIALDYMRLAHKLPGG